MSQQHNGGPVFPHNDHHVYSERVGMSLRDYFAAKAMQSMLTGNRWDIKELVESSYQVADAMLEARQPK